MMQDSIEGEFMGRQGDRYTYLSTLKPYFSQIRILIMAKP